MANRDAEQILLEEQRRLTNGGSSKPAGLLDSIQKVTSGTRGPNTVAVLSSSFKPAAAAVTAAMSGTINKGYTVPSAQSPTPGTSSGSSVAGEIGKTALNIFTSGLGLAPLVSGLAGLFGGSDPSTPPPLVKYAIPRPIQITAANSRDGGALSFADYGQNGTVRSFDSNWASSDSDASNLVAATQAAPAQTSAPAGHIVVNVQAMDSRSFLDHSQEIAQAVREAMLNMHALNDVVSEL